MFCIVNLVLVFSYELNLFVILKFNVRIKIFFVLWFYVVIDSFCVNCKDIIIVVSKICVMDGFVLLRVCVSMLCEFLCFYLYFDMWGNNIWFINILDILYFVFMEELIKVWFSN